MADPPGQLKIMFHNILLRERAMRFHESLKTLFVNVAKENGLITF